MSGIFLKAVNMSISAGWIVLAVTVLRLILKKAPAWIHVALWAIVAVRLMVPFTVQSTWSLLPSSETFPERVISGPEFDVQTGITPVDEQINRYLDARYFEGVTVQADNGSRIMSVLSVIWIIGILILTVYAAVSCRSLKRKVETAARYRDNIWACGRKVGLLRIVTNDEIHKRTNSDCITTAGFYRFSKKGYRTSWLSL